MPFHQFLQDFQRCLAIPRLRHNAFQHLGFMIDGAPKVVRHPVDLHVDLVQVPAPVLVGAHPVDPSSPDLGGKHRAEPVPPEPHCLMTDVDTAFVQEVHYVAKRQQKPDVELTCQANDLKRGFEVTEGALFGLAGC